MAKPPGQDGSTLGEGPQYPRADSLPSPITGKPPTCRYSAVLTFWEWLFPREIWTSGVGSDDFLGEGLLAVAGVLATTCLYIASSSLWSSHTRGFAATDTGSLCPRDTSAGPKIQHVGSRADRQGFHSQLCDHEQTPQRWSLLSSSAKWESDYLFQDGCETRKTEAQSLTHLSDSFLPSSSTGPPFRG